LDYFSNGLPIVKFTDEHSTLFHDRNAVDAELTMSPKMRKLRVDLQPFILFEIFGKLGESTET
jgi:hypothetical protein